MSMILGKILSERKSAPRELVDNLPKGVNYRDGQYILRTKDAKEKILEELKDIDISKIFKSVEKT